MNLLTVAIQEAKKSRKLELERRRSAGALSADDISSDVIIQQEATVISRKLSADGSAFMMSSVTSSNSADGLKEQSQDISRYQLEAYVLYQLDNQTQATAASSRELQNPVARKEDVAKLCNQAQSFQSTKISAEDELSRSDEPAAKQLTIYEELSKLDTHFKWEEGVSNWKKSEQRLIYFKSAIEENHETTLVQLQYCGRNTLITQCTNRGKNEQIDEAIDRH
ncbi:alpha-glucan water dikinase, chloroplastic [Dorcoceras hygrometricum]|uniref:Alpha-glucan water dikinase, chloroplastic n=1 Tax=Dorcoceras hygrometricum TaxID=472368 RepID=A0A2Z7CE21_9LAMI|nr:alpha-glucan water dikinase, chloroplastic [Dorcoceras hygrometricum]